MYKGTLVDILLGVVENAEKSSRTVAVPKADSTEESTSDRAGDGENQSPNSSRNRLV
jgi:hypothetical protein